MDGSSAINYSKPLKTPMKRLVLLYLLTGEQIACNDTASAQLNLRPRRASRSSLGIATAGKAPTSQ
jgi:hypothetical protein